MSMFVFEVGLLGFYFYLIMVVVFLVSLGMSLGIVGILIIGFRSVSGGE